jgi:two-component system chemotaxis sensor kinase CheA
LLDLLAMHVERERVSIASVARPPQANMSPVSGGASPAAVRDATVRVDADALRRLLLLARKLARTSGDANGLGASTESNPWLQGLGALCQGLEDLGSASASSLFERIPPLLQRLSAQLDKAFDLSVTGGDLRVDRVVLQRMADPLMHLVRNACDHGIELAPVRLAAGKPRAGQIDVSAWQEPGRVRISVRDDGAGLSRDEVLRAARARAIPFPADLDDSAVWQLVFSPGLSTAGALSQVSGRGVGMDAVRRQVVSLGGEVSITSSAGKGVCVTLSIPVAPALADPKAAG